MHISWLEGLRNHEHRTRCEQEVLRRKKEALQLALPDRQGQATLKTSPAAVGMQKPSAERHLTGPTCARGHMHN